MALRIIVKEPDPILREVCKPVPKITPNIHKLLDDMAETMYHARGVGIAAPQIGILKRVVVIDTQETEDSKLVELINPEILEKSGEQFGPEGCLSIPGINGEVKRYQWLRVKALDRDGNEMIFEAEDFFARVIQHEIDHLNGVLFTDIAEHIYEREEEANAGEQRE